MHPADERAAELSRRQYGYFTRRQIEDVASPGLIARRLNGRWEAADHGLYRLPGHPVTWSSRLMAACLVGNAIVSHRSSAVLWELEGVRRGRPEVTVARRSRFRRDSVRVHQSTQFDDRLAMTTRQGLPVTGVGRTIIDISWLVGYERTLIAIDDARRRRLITWPDLYDVLVQHARRGRNGAGRLRALLVHHYGEPVVTDSAFERMVSQLLIANGLSGMQLQHEVSDGDFTARLDLAYPHQKVGIELDGRHHITDEAFEADPVRRNRLTLLGWTILNFTWRFYADQPLALVASVRAALRQGELRHQRSVSGL